MVAVASLVLQDVPTGLLERLELRAKKLGVTPSEEALHLLRASLLGGGAGAAPAEPGVGADELLEERGGLLVFTGRLDPASIPSVDEVREQRIEDLIRGGDEAGD